VDTERGVACGGHRPDRAARMTDLRAYLSLHNERIALIQTVARDHQRHDSSDRHWKRLRDVTTEMLALESAAGAAKEAA
jgi:hypothetical protein